MLFSEIIGNKISVWGLGQEGIAILRRLRAFNFFDNINVITDKPLSFEEKEELLHLYPLTFYAKDEIENVLNQTEVLIKAPGVSLYRSEIINAKSKGIKITSSTNIWFAESLKNQPNMKIIGVTGTKGKSTTSSLVAHFLRVAGLNTAVGGNIGVPLVDFLGRNNEFDATVAEISSYQASDLKFSPDVGVLVNLYPEHIDWHGSHERYYLDKLNMFANRKKHQLAILNYEDARTQEMCKNLKNVIWFNYHNAIHVGDDFIMDGMKRLFPFSAVKIRGRHNLCNICAALTVIKALGLDLSSCANAVGDFEGLQHRLQIVAEKDALIFVNDSISTAPETAVAAIEAFSDRPIALIAGGYDREQDYKVLAESALKFDVRAIATIPTTGSRIAKTVRDIFSKSNKTILVTENKSLDEAFFNACKSLPDGGVVLLSPAAPSYGVYKDFKERGNHFIRLVKDNFKVG